MADLDARQPRRREGLVPRRITARTTRCWCSPATSTSPTAQAAGREIFRRDPARARRACCRPSPVPTLAAPKAETMKDRVAATLVAARLGGARAQRSRRAGARRRRRRCSAGCASSRLDNALVQQEKLAVQVSAGDSDDARRSARSRSRRWCGPGVDPALVGAAARRDPRRLPARTARPPTRCSASSPRACRGAHRAGWNRSAGSAARRWRWRRARSIRAIPASTRSSSPRSPRRRPASVKAAADKWLTRPAYTLTVVPGERDAYAEAQRAAAKADGAAAPEPPVKGTRGAAARRSARSTGLSLPDGRAHAARERDRAGLCAAHRGAGHAGGDRASTPASPPTSPDKLGTQQLTLAMIDEGTATLRLDRRSPRREERLGARYRQRRLAPTAPTLSLRRAERQSRRRRSTCSPTSSRSPAFAEAELARVKQQQLARHRAGADQPRRARRSACVPPLALRRGAAPTRRRSGGGDPARGGGADPRRSGRVPAGVAAARQGEDLRRQRPPARRGQGGARRALRRLDARPARRAPRRSPRRSRRRRRKIVLVDRPDQPAVADRRRDRRPG